MKLDFDLIRQILLHMQDTPANQRVSNVRIAGYDEDNVFEHLELLEQRGLLDANITYAGSGEKRIYAVYVKNLTWEGHQFLENARNNEVWSRTKSLVEEKGGSVSFEIFKSLLTQVTMNFFGVQS
jgi:hypothetical protein